MSEVQFIETKRLHTNKMNPRLEIDPERLTELSESIKKVGILQPIIVRPLGDGFEVVVGERRYRAARQANIDKVPAIVRNFTDEEIIELNLIENVQREDLSVVEKAKACKQLRDKFPLKYSSWEKVAETLGISIKTLQMWTRTLALPEEMQKLVAPAYTYRVPEGKIDYQTAIHVTARIKEPEKQVEMAREIVERRIPVRDVRRVIAEVAEKPDETVKEVVSRIVEEPFDIPFRLSHMQPILNGTKTQTSRTGIPDPKVKEGAIIHAAVWEPRFADLRVKSIERKRLKYFDENDAKNEGGYTLEEFKEVWKKLHGDWDEDQLVYVIHFEKVK